MRRVIITVIACIVLPGVTYAQVGDKVDSIYNAAKKELADTHVENAEKMFADLYSEYKDYRAMNALALISYNKGDKKKHCLIGDRPQNNYAQCLEFGIECENDLAQALYWAELADNGDYSNKIRTLKVNSEYFRLAQHGVDAGLYGLGRFVLKSANCGPENFSSIFIECNQHLILPINMFIFVYR